MWVAAVGALPPPATKDDHQGHPRWNRFPGHLCHWPFITNAKGLKSDWRDDLVPSASAFFRRVFDSISIDQENRYWEDKVDGCFRTSQMLPSHT